METPDNTVNAKHARVPSGNKRVSKGQGPGIAAASAGTCGGGSRGARYSV